MDLVKLPRLMNCPWASLVAPPASWIFSVTVLPLKLWTFTLENGAIELLSYTV